MAKKAAKKRRVGKKVVNKGMGKVRANATKTVRKTGRVGRRGA